MSANAGGKSFFDIPMACSLMGKSVNQVLEQCAAFDPQLFTANRLLEDEYKTLQRLKKLADPSVVDSDIDDKLFFETFDANVGFHCHFKLQDYQAFSFVGINFVNNTAVECVVSLGLPSNPERYSSELEVTKVFLVSLEELYLNGRIQEESEPETRVYTWKKGNIAISFVSYPPSHSSKDTGVRLSVQIRDTQLHPQGEYFEFLYNSAQKSVQDPTGRIKGPERKSPTQRATTTPVEALDVPSELESFCSDYITALGEALNIAIKVGHEEYEAGFNSAMDLLSKGPIGLGLHSRNPFQFGVLKEDRPKVLSEIKRYAEVAGIPYNKLSPLNQFMVTIPPYVFYCLEKYLIDDPGLREEARHLMSTRGFPRYLQEDLGYPISQKIRGAFWRPKPFASLARLFGFGRRD